MKREMISAVKVYNDKFSNNDRYLSDVIFEEAKDLIIKQLNSPDLEVEKGDDGFHHEYTKIIAIIARTPKKEYSGTITPGVGEYKRWFVLGMLNEEQFPMDRLNEWLEDFGWALKICGNDNYFEVVLESSNFETEAMNEQYWKCERTYFPKYMDM